MPTSGNNADRGHGFRLFLIVVYDHDATCTAPLPSHTNSPYLLVVERMRITFWRRAVVDLVSSGCLPALALLPFIGPSNYAKPIPLYGYVPPFA